jgi:hypothetical protein
MALKPVLETNLHTPAIPLAPILGNPLYGELCMFKSLFIAYSPISIKLDVP